MRRIVKAALLSSTLFLAFIAPSAADEAKQPAPAAAPAGDGQLLPSTEAGGCPAGGKCCGSAACAEAKKQPLKDGEAAAHDCPCRRNKNKPQHDH